MLPCQLFLELSTVLQEPQSSGTGAFVVSGVRFPCYHATHKQRLGVVKLMETKHTRYDESPDVPRCGTIPPPSRRYMVVQVDPQMFVNLMKRGGLPRVVHTGLPPDARMVGMGSPATALYLPDYGMLHMVVESAEFEPVPEGHVIPLAKVVWMEVPRGTCT